MPDSQPGSTRVVVVGADALARAGLVAALREEPAVEVASAAAPGDPRGLLLAHDADALLWDAGPGGEVDLPEIEVPVVVVVAEEGAGGAALSAGARGVLLRDADGPRLAAALAAVVQGLVVLDERLSDAVTRDRPDPGALPAPLTDLEREVLELMSLGYTNRELGEALGISVHTAKFHVNAILGKLDATTRTEAVVRAARLGLLTL